MNVCVSYVTDIAIPFDPRFIIISKTSVNSQHVNHNIGRPRKVFSNAWTRNGLKGTAAVIDPNLVRVLIRILTQTAINFLSTNALMIDRIFSTITIETVGTLCCLALPIRRGIINA